MAKPNLSPFVYWGQNKDRITLNVALRDVKNPVIELGEENLTFSAIGEGLQGVKQYQFSIDLYQFIDDKKSKYTVTEKNIEFRLVKQNREVWPRLTYSNKKPQWLKVNFDHFAVEDEDSSSSDDEEKEKLLRKDFAERETAALEKHELNKLRQFYLFVYNSFMFGAYAYIFIAMCVQYYHYGEAAKLMTFESFGGPMSMLQALAIIEVINPLCGAVKTPVLAPALQFSGRGFILFIVLWPNSGLHGKVPVWWLFGTWSMSEVARYPFYMLRSYNKDFGLITWIRYSAWIILYPIGFVSEGLIMLQSLHFYDEGGVWSLQLPNQVNMSFSFPVFLRLYMLAFLPAALMLINHMYIQRKKKISPVIFARQQKKKANSGPIIFSQKVKKVD